MRHIVHRHAPDDAAWVTKATQILAQLDAAPDAATRNAIIDANSAVWGEIKQWLLSLSHQKCWFSEAKDASTTGTSSTTGPRNQPGTRTARSTKATGGSRSTGTTSESAATLGNRKKGTYFPLRAGCPRCAAHGDLRHEDPQLLDPVDPDDPALISFNLEGRAIPAPHVTDGWEKSRVEYSVERYNLDFPPLMDKRKAVWANCWDQIQQYLKDLHLYHTDKTNGIARDRYKQAMRALREMICDDKELSAVARACVLSSGDRRLIGIL
jgi:hypothetical protein